MTADQEEDVLGTLERIVRAERAHLTRIARQEGLGAEDTLDSVRDAFCTFLQMALRGDLPGTEAEQVPLLAGIVRNTARNKRRRHHLAMPHRAIDAIERADDAPSTETLVAHAEECVRLRGCVNSLC